MKRVICLLVIAFMFLELSGCGASTASPKSLEMTDFIQAYKEAGIIESEDKPFFALINAKDGIAFTMDEYMVKVYEYGSSSDVDKAKKDFTIMKDWPINGRFVLESKQDKAIEVFKSVK